MTSPLKTDVIAKDTPVVVPTMPLARSRRSAGTSRVTQVDSTMLRSPPATDPTRMSATNVQNQGLRRLSTEPASTSTNMAVASVKQMVEVAVVRTIAWCLRWRST